MKQRGVSITMEKILGISELRETLGTVFDEIQFQNTKYIVQRRGKPAVAIVPLDIYEGWKKDRERLFELITKAQEGNDDLSEDDVMALVLEAQNAVRNETSNAEFK